MRSIVSAIVVALVFGAGPALAGGPFGSRTELSAAQEVQDPPVESNGVAKAIVVFDGGFGEARVFVRFRHLVGDQVTRLHFHCKEAGDNGPIALGLIDTVNAAFDNSDTIHLGDYTISGRLTNADFPAEDACPGAIGRPVNNLVSLAAAIDAGLVYWNLHTDAFPAGEVRGQVRPLQGR